MKKFLLNVLILLLFAGYTLAQDHVVTGTVYEKTDKKKIPLPGVNVYWSGTQVGAVPDENGKFPLHRKPVYNLLVVSFVGFKSDTIAVAHDHKSVEVLLSSVKELDEVVVSEKQQSSFISQLSPMQVQHVTGDELQKAACCNLSESFETNASVDVSYSDAVTGAKKVELLGLHGKYSQMMTENIPNLRGLATPYGLGYIPGSWMESIQISKGAASVVNGYESMTGQINIGVAGFFAVGA